MCIFAIDFKGNREALRSFLRIEMSEPSIRKSKIGVMVCAKAWTVPNFSFQGIRQPLSGEVAYQHHASLLISLNEVRESAKVVPDTY